MLVVSVNLIPVANFNRSPKFLYSHVEVTLATAATAVSYNEYVATTFAALLLVTLSEGNVIVSATDHFTDFINATLAMPDEPAGMNYTPNSIQELAKADPAAEISVIAPPEGGATGDATVD